MMTRFLNVFLPIITAIALVIGGWFTWIDIRQAVAVSHPNDFWQPFLFLAIFNGFTLHFTGTASCYLVVAYVTRVKRFMPRFQPTNHEDGRNAWPEPQGVPRWFWSGAPNHTRGLMTAALFAVVAFPILGYHLWSSGYQLLVIVLATLMFVLNFLLGPMIAGVIPHHRTNTAFWSTVAAVGGWFASACFDYIHQYITSSAVIPYGAVGGMLGWAAVGAFVIVGGSVLMVSAIADYWHSDRNPLVRLSEPGDAVIVQSSGQALNIDANITEELDDTLRPEHGEIPGDGFPRVHGHHHHDEHHHHHVDFVPLPVGIDPDNSRLKDEWLLWGPLMYERRRLRIPDIRGVMVHFLPDWAPSLEVRAYQGIDLGSDPHADRLTIEVTAAGAILWNVFRQQPELHDTLEGHGENHGGAHGDHGHGHAPKPRRIKYSYGMKKVDATSGKVPDRSGIDYQTKLNGDYCVVSARRLRNTANPSAFLHHEVADMAGWMATNGAKTVGRIGPVGDLAQDLPATAPHRLSPIQERIQRIVGILGKLRHMTQITFIRTGCAVSNLVLEDVNLEPMLKKEMQIAFQLFFKTDPEILHRLADGDEIVMNAEVQGLFGALQKLGITKEDLGEALPSWLLARTGRLDSHMWVGGPNPLPAAPSGVRGRRGGGNPPAGGNPGGGTP